MSASAEMEKWEHVALLDHRDRDLQRSHPNAAVSHQAFARYFLVEGSAEKGGEGDGSDQRALEGAYVRRNQPGNHTEGVLGRSYAVERGALTKNGEACGAVGGPDPRDEAGRKALAQAGLDAGEIGGETIARDTLPPAFVERVEGVKHLLFAARLALEKLDVVDEQHVDIAEVRFERLGTARVQGRKEGVGSSAVT